MSLIAEINLEESEGKSLVELLKSILYGNDNFQRFFPEDKEKRIRDNFALFDRDGDGFVNIEETIELLNSIDVGLSEHDTNLLFKELIQEDKGVSCDDFFLLITKKIKDDDKETELMQNFKLIDKEGTGMIKDIEGFKDLLMSKGLKWTEEQVDELLEVMNPKGGDSYSYSEFCRSITKKEESKGKKKKKKKKK